ncbi:ATP-binding protein [Caballeronia sp. dw_276]|uniref:ATP-binding protein n=1 Tax=Caballeronia sp. dw_276 TaxID=2719795 RepID=UPI001BD27779|nr:ATP-binding protein [Caballeronia sp. dw_276]
MIGSSDKSSQWGYLVRLWISGSVLLCAIAWLCLNLQLRIATTGFCMLIVIVLLSLLDSFISSAIFSIVGGLLLNIFFTPPIYSFEIEKPQDVLPITAFFITSIAITSLVRRIRTAERLQREQARLLDLTHDTVFVRDRQDVITYWNHAAEVLYGWNRSEAIGKVADNLLKTVFPMPREEAELALLRNGYWEGDLVHLKRDGSSVLVASRWTVQRDSQGQPCATLETNNDITQRRQAEELVRKSQAQYLAEAQQLSRTGSFGWNVATDELFCSEEAFRIFECDPARAPTLDTVRERLHPEDVHLFEHVVSQVRGTGEDFDIEHRLLFPDGRVKHLHVVAHSTHAVDDNRQFIGAVMDVTGARETETQLRQTQNELARASRITALGELSASIAHEVGQPLAAIITSGEACLRWLHRDPPNFEEIEGCVNEMTNEGNRAAEIVQRVRKLMKGAPPEHAPVNVNELVGEVVALTRTEMESHGCCLVLNLEPKTLAVLGDRVQLQQVLINIIINGLQSMASAPDKHRLALSSLTDVNGSVVLAVRDNGPGISDANLPRLFDAFFTTRSTGMGMGLAICSSIIEAHGGQISASNNPEGGATFCVTLPLSQASAVAT